MTFSLKFAAPVFAVCSMLAAPTIADGALEKAIGARKAQMQLYAFNLGQLGAMAKGKVDYDAKAAKAAADNLVVLSSMSGGAMWPQGSDSTAMPGKTRAKVEAWTTYPASAKAGEALTVAATNLAAVAGDGLDSLRGAIGDVGKSCGGCHKPFREEE